MRDPNLPRYVFCERIFCQGGHIIFDVQGAAESASGPVYRSKDWMKVVLQTQKESDGHVSLLIMITSNFGSFGHRWPSLYLQGKDSEWMVSLAGMGKAEFLRDISGGDHIELDVESILLLAEEKINQEQARGTLGARSAKTLLESVQHLGSQTSAEYVLGALSNFQLFAGDVDTCFRVPALRPNIQKFWSNLWLPFSQHLFREYEDQRGTAESGELAQSGMPV